MNTSPSWHDHAAALALDGRALINGQRVPNASGETFDKHSPIDGRHLAAIARGQTADIDAAVASARAAFDDGRWAHQPPAARKKTLQRFAEAILAHRDELALLETLDMGKPIQFARSVDVPAAARTIAWYAEAIDKVYDEIAPTGRNALALITREPMGVVGVIVPWNYPMIMAAWKLGPALATGNSVVMKPSEKSPLTALRLAEIAVEAGLPPGVFNVVPGYGHEAGEALALHMDVDAIGFTGSTRTGRRMLDYAGRSNLKRVYNELGGKSAFLVSPTTATRPGRRAPSPAACFSTKASRATRRRGCWSTPRSPTSSWRPSPPKCRSTSPVTRLTQPPSWARWSMKGRCAPCWATSTPAVRRARLATAGSRRVPKPAASTSSQPCSTTPPTPCASPARRSSGRCCR
jgi:hypothetical protein